MGVSGAGARSKGHNFERELAILFRPLYGPGVRRGLQYQDGTGVPDLIGLPFHVEAKVGKRPNIRAAMDQAIDDSATFARLKNPAAASFMDLKLPPPLVITKEDRNEPLATMRLEDFMDLLKMTIRAQGGGEWPARYDE